MGHKTLTHNLDGTSTFTDTRSVEEAHEENLSAIRQRITDMIHARGYDEIWHRNVALGLVDNAEEGADFIQSLRNAYHDYKARLLASTRDEADGVKFNYPNGQL